MMSGQNPVEQNKDLLLICAPAPVRQAGEKWFLDVKFVEGMRRHQSDWQGPVHCLLWETQSDIPFGEAYAAEDLGFGLTMLPAGSLPSVIPDAAVAFLSADMVEFPRLTAHFLARQIPIVASLEYTLETRMRILRLDTEISALRRIRRMLWQVTHERNLRRSLTKAAGVQFNGWPSYAAYAHLTPRPHLYLDNRMEQGMMATQADMQARAARLRSGAPLRLIHSGRLEPMKGSQDLLPLMRALAQNKIDATLDIYGAGSLAPSIRAALPEFDGKVRLHDPVDFRTKLVPINRGAADIFLSCHRQSDPSCSYIEAMGCGLAVAGYDNRMWSALCKASGGGLMAPLGQTEALAASIAQWHQNREQLISATEAALAYAKSHCFETEFGGRIRHLRHCASVHG